MIIVLGGGPAGRFAAMHLAGAGKEVTLVERGGIGGQCLHYGCMPVCALGDVARLVRQARNLAALGVIDSAPSVNFPVLLSAMQIVQDKIAGILDEETRKTGVTVVYGKEGHLNGRSVSIGGETLEPEAVIAATGSRPRIPDIPGISLNGVYTPHTLRTMRQLPARLAIIGGGIMGAEYAHIFQAFGSEVHLIARSGLLKDLDPHLRALARKELAGVTIHENTDLRSLSGERRVESLSMDSSEGHRAIDVDAVLVAAGLVPNSEMLQGIAKRKNGIVIVDDHMRTSVPGVYACGDVTGPPNLTPMARHEGIIAAENILGRDVRADYRAIPQSLSLLSECAFVNRERDSAASVVIPAPAGPGSFWQVPTGETGLAKIYFDPESGKLEGFCAAYPGGGLVASYLSLLMRKGMTIQEMDELFEVHPSTDGMYWLIRFCAEKLREKEN